MPLRAKGESLGALDRHRLDDAVRCPRFDGKSRRNLLDRLAMQAVNHSLALAENALEHAARGDRDRMDGTIFDVHVLDLARAVIEAPLAALHLGLERAAQ